VEITCFEFCVSKDVKISCFTRREVAIEKVAAYLCITTISGELKIIVE